MKKLALCLVLSVLPRLVYGVGQQSDISDLTQDNNPIATDEIEIQGTGGSAVDEKTTLGLLGRVIKGRASAVLTGSIDASASASVVGVGTLFTTELMIGDRITVSSETRTVTAIADALNLTVHAAFSDTANDTSPDVLAAPLRVEDTSGNLLFLGQVGGATYIVEQADAGDDLAAYGQLWVNTATPNELWFTDDAGSDFQIAGDITGTSLDISGDIDVDGTSNLDIVDIDGAVDMASTLTVGNTLIASNISHFPSLTINNNSTIGSVYDSDAILIATGGGVTLSQTLGVTGTSTLAAATLSGNTLVGLTSAETIATVIPKLQVESTGNTAGISVFRNSNDAGGPYVLLGSSRGTSVNADTIVQDDDILGHIVWVAADGVDRLSAAASIVGYVDGTPGANDTPGRLVFSTTADGAQTATSRFQIASDGAATFSGTLGVTGVVTANAGVVVDNITIDGTEIDLSSGDLTIDSGGDIEFDAAGNDIILSKNGTERGRFVLDAADFKIKSAASNSDLIFQGNDGGSEIAALTLDMSDAGAATFNAAVTANAGVVVDNITIDGTEIDLSSGDFTLDVAGDTYLDADGGDWMFSDAGTTILGVHNVSNNAVLKANVSDADMILKGTDDASEIAALTLDMSDAGAATFNGVVTANAGVVVDNITIDGTEIDLSSGDLTLDSAGDITLDAGGADIFLKDDGTTFGQIFQSSSSLYIKSSVSDGDMIFQGNDGGSGINALTFDMSDAGFASFNTGAVINESGANSDSRIESDGNPNMFYVNAGDNAVGIGTDTDLGGAFNVSGTAVISTADNLDTLSLISTDVDGNAGPNLRLYRNSSSVNDGDSMGTISFVGRNDAPEDHAYASIQARIVDASNATEDGRLELMTSVATAEGTSRILMNGTETVINDNSKDLDLRVESDGNASMLVVDGGADAVGIGIVPSNTFSVGASGTVTTRYTSTDTSAFSLLQFENSGSIVFSADHGDSAANSDIIFKSDGAQERMRIDSSGNVGIGVTPESGWHASWTALQLGATGFVGQYQVAGTDITGLGSNVYSDGTYRYIETDEAAILKLQNGTFIFDVAASGDADAAIDWTTAMTIDNSGALDLTAPSTYPQFTLSDNRTDNTIKNPLIGAVHYDIEEEDVGLIHGLIETGSNKVNIGGGTSQVNAATAVNVYIGANSTTTTGTVAATVDSDGLTLTGGQIDITGTDPTFVGDVCGTSPAVVGSDAAGKITVGTTTTTSCAMTFATAYSNAPACVVSGDINATLYSAATTTTVLTITSSVDMDSDVVMFICIGL